MQTLFVTSFVFSCSFKQLRTSSNKNKGSASAITEWFDSARVLVHSPLCYLCYKNAYKLPHNPNSIPHKLMHIYYRVVSWLLVISPKLYIYAICMLAQLDNELATKYQLIFLSYLWRKKIKYLAERKRFVRIFCRFSLNLIPFVQNTHPESSCALWYSQAWI